MSQKNELRSLYRAKRSEYLASMNPAIANLSFSALPSNFLAIVEKSRCLAAYIPIGSEANPMKLAEKARELGLQICLPYVESKISPMRFIAWEASDPLIDGPMGLKQPSPDGANCKPDLILAPLLAFDRSMTRLGQGAGHYDRALSLLGHSIIIGMLGPCKKQSSFRATLGIRRLMPF